MNRSIRCPCDILRIPLFFMKPNELSIHAISVKSHIHATSEYSPHFRRGVHLSSLHHLRPVTWCISRLQQRPLRTHARARLSHARVRHNQAHVRRRHARARFGPHRSTRSSCHPSIKRCPRIFHRFMTIAALRKEQGLMRKC